MYRVCGILEEAQTGSVNGRRNQKDSEVSSYAGFWLLPCLRPPDQCHRANLTKSHPLIFEGWLLLGGWGDGTGN